MSWPIPAEGTPYDEWQDGRCGNCGLRWRGALVRDHDHATGLERGLLCRGCNSSEGQSNHPTWVRWRAGWNPAALLGDERVYDGGWAADQRERWELLNPEPTKDELRAAINLLPAS